MKAEKILKAWKQTKPRPFFRNSRTVYSGIYQGPCVKLDVGKSAVALASGLIVKGCN